MCDTLSTTKKPSSEKDAEFSPSTSIITKRSFLPMIKGYSQKHVKPWHLPHSHWHPHANIYYSNSEDTNPFTRLDELEKSKVSPLENVLFQPHFPPPENPFLKRDPYSENEAKQKYLETQPVCFVIFGKPGLDTHKLAKMISESWNCVLVSPETQIEEEIRKNTENGQRIANILNSGGSVGQEIIIELIEERINQRDVKHRGYVIEGLPLIPNDPNLDYSSYPDPEDLDVNEKFSTCVPSTHDPSNKTFDFIEREGETGSKIPSEFENPINSGTRIRKCYECDIPRQIKDMFSLWLLKPQIIIYMMCPESDLHYKRDQLFWDPHSGEIIDRTNGINNQNMIDNDQNMIDNNQNMIDINQKTGFNLIETHEKILKLVKTDESAEKHFVKRIVDMTPNINFQIEIYKKYALPTIDKIILEQNPQNVIRVDGRASAKEMFQIVSLKLRLLPLPKVLVPMKISNLQESRNDELDSQSMFRLTKQSFKISKRIWRNESTEEIYGEDMTENPNQNFEGKTKEEIFEELSYRGAISPRFRWRLSNWKFFCPVELAKGRRVEGQIKYAIRFMNSLYFLSSQEAENSFIENPRPYLLPPNPRSSCKIAIIGPRYSGKTKLSHDLAEYLGGTVIDIRKSEDELIEEEIQKKIAIMMRENLDSVIREVKEILQKEREERENKRLEELKSWSSGVRGMLNRLQILKNASEGYEAPEGYEASEGYVASEGYEPSEGYEASEGYKASEELKNIRQTLQKYGIHFLENDIQSLKNDIQYLENDIQFLENDDLQIINQDGSLIEAYAPDYLKTEEQPIPELTEHDPEVVMMLENRLKSLREEPIRISSEDKVKMILEKIGMVPPIVGEITRDGGWILDDMYLDPEVWMKLNESGLEINVIVLFNEAPYEYLIKNWRQWNDYAETDSEYNNEDINIRTGSADLIEEEAIDSSELSNYQISIINNQIQTSSNYVETIREFEKNLKMSLDQLKKLGKEFILCDLGKVDIFEYVHSYFDEEFNFKAVGMTDEERKIERDLGNFRSEELDGFEENDDDEDDDEENDDEKVDDEKDDDENDDDDDKEEEEEEEDVEEEEAEGGSSTEIPTKDNRRFGDTSSYCPVALMRHGVLWKGKENLSAFLANKIYLLSSKRALEEFIKNSREFSLPLKEPLRKIPPLRICIVGPPGSGKTTMAKAISKENGLAHIDFFEKIDDYLLELGFNLVDWKQDDLFETEIEEILKEDDEDNLEDPKTNDAKSEDRITNDLKSEDRLNNAHKSEDQLNDVLKSKKPEAGSPNRVFVINKNITESAVRNYREGGNLPEAMLTEILFKYFKPPFDTCGVIFDSFPNCAQDVELILKNYAVPEIIIELNCSLELAQDRLFPVLLKIWKTQQDRKKLEEQRRYDIELQDFNERKEDWIKGKLKVRRMIDRFEENEFSEFDNGAPHPSLASVGESHVIFEEPTVTITKIIEDKSQKLSSDSDSNLDLNIDSNLDLNIDSNLDLNIDSNLDLYSEQIAADRMELEKLYFEINPKPKIFTDWEDEFSAEERIIKKIEKAYKSSKKNLRKTRDRMKKESIPWIEIDSQIGVVQLFCTLLRILDPYLHRNSSFLVRTYEISIKIAEQLLDSGYYFLSSFGRYCPVQLYEEKIPFHMFLPLETKGEIFPILHRQYIYFLSGREALRSFKKDPLKYLDQDSCSPLIPVQISIIGPPKCGKTTLAQRFARTYGFKVLTRGQALRHILEKYPWTDLATSIEKNLREINLATDEQVARTIDFFSIDPRSSLGFILDGFPASQSEAEELALIGIKPMIILDLEANIDFCLECLETDAESIKKPSIFSPEFLIHQYQSWKDGEKQLRDWLSGFTANIIKIDATRSKWGVWTRADEVVRHRFTAIKKYFREADYDKVHHLEHLCVTPYEFKKRESIYQAFCPVCIQFDILRSSSVPLDRKGVVQFRDHFYWICPKHIDIFIEEPFEYLKKELPSDRPEILEGTIDIEHACWAKRLRSGGYCLVTYVESLPYRKLVAGKQDLALLYKDRLYLFCTIECRDRFIARSENYSGVEIHFQKTLPSVQVKNLPNLGFLEQSVASLIVKAVSYLGVLRPKLPGHSASTTAAIYFGTYLKTHNLNCDLKEVTIYEDVIKRMEMRSEILRIVTLNMKNKVNPYVTLITEEGKEKLEMKNLKIQSSEDKFEDRTIASKSSQFSRHSSSVKFRRTSPTQILTDTDSIVSSIST